MISFQIYFLRNGKRMVLKSINENDNFLIISAANKNNLAKKVIFAVNLGLALYLTFLKMAQFIKLQFRVPLSFSYLLDTIH